MKFDYIAIKIYATTDKNESFGKDWELETLGEINEIIKYLETFKNNHMLIKKNYSNLDD